jgi:hypothetical protein
MISKSLPIFLVIFSGIFPIFFSSAAMANAPFVTFAENRGAKICGNLYVSAKDIWVSDGVTKVTLYTHGDLKSKPMSGGYGWGDSVQVGPTEKRCKYFVSITKTGPVGRPGTVTLSRNPPDPQKKPICEPSLTIEKVGWGRIEKSKEVLEAELKTGDVFWIDACAYRLEAVNTKTQDNVRSPSGGYEINPESLYFEKLDHYLPPAP